MSAKIFRKLTELMETHPSSEQILQRAKELAEMGEPTIRTISTRWSRIKGFLRDNYAIQDKILRKMKPSDEITQTIIQENSERRNEKTQFKFNQELVNDLLELRTSTNPFERAVYAQFVSGRRISELFENDMKVDSKNPKNVKIRLNKESSDKKHKFSTVELLKDDDLTGREFKELVAKIRSSVNGMTLGEFTKRVNRVLKKMGTDITSHGLRAMYGVYRHATDNPDNLILTGYLSKVLHHAPGSDSGINYSHMVFEE
jgi:hypothetical protein